MTDEERAFMADLKDLLLKHDVNIIAEHEQLDIDWDETKISFLSNKGVGVEIEMTDLVSGQDLLGILETNND